MHISPLEMSSSVSHLLSPNLLSLIHSGKLFIVSGMCRVLHCLWNQQIPLISHQVHTREADVRPAFNVTAIKEDILSRCSLSGYQTARHTIGRNMVADFSSNMKEEPSYDLRVNWECQKDRDSVSRQWGLVWLYPGIKTMGIHIGALSPIWWGPQNTNRVHFHYTLLARN